MGQPRHWPVSYLHKEPPPNSTSVDPKADNNMITDRKAKYAAIEDLINAIKGDNNKKGGIQYRIQKDGSEDKSNGEEVLYVKIPLPANVSKEIGNKSSVEDQSLQAVDVFLTSTEARFPKDSNTIVKRLSAGFSTSHSEEIRPKRARFAKGFVERIERPDSYGGQSRKS